MTADSASTVATLRATLATFVAEVQAGKDPREVSQAALKSERLASCLTAFVDLEASSGSTMPIAECLEHHCADLLAVSLLLRKAVEARLSVCAQTSAGGPLEAPQPTGDTARARRFWKLPKIIRSWIAVPLPTCVEAVEKLRHREPLYPSSQELNNPVHFEADTFVLYRIIGNDLPPRHRAGQSIANLRFILENEPELALCEKRFVLNRIIDPKIETAMRDLLHQHGVGYLRLPYNAAEYATIPDDYSTLGNPDILRSKEFLKASEKDKNRIRVAINRHRNNYVMHNNGARNSALAEGRTLAKWVLPFDGNCFFTAAAWEGLLKAARTTPWLSYFVVPMARIVDNQQLLQPGFQPNANEEPQLLFRRDAREIFDPQVPYGRRPKVELFWRLGIPGPWDYWTDQAWDLPRRHASPDAGRFGLASWVARLFSGVSALEQSGKDAPSKRGVARQEAILQLLDQLKNPG